MSCEANIKRNLGLSRCGMPGMPKYMITLPKGTAISQADFVSKAAWNTKLLAAYGARVYLWPLLRTVEYVGSLPIYEITPQSTMKVRKGTVGWRFGLKESLCLHTAMFSHNSSGDVDVVIIDNYNNFIGTLDEDGMVRGFSIDLLNVEDIQWSDGSVSSKSPVYLMLEDSDQLNENGIMFRCTFVNQLYRIIDVDIEMLLVTDAGDIDVQVSQHCDGTPLSGLALADFVYRKDSDGSAVAITTRVEDANVPGKYKLTQVGDLFVDGKVYLVTPSALTLKAYETYTPAVINIP